MPRLGACPPHHDGLLGCITLLTSVDVLPLLLFHHPTPQNSPMPPSHRCRRLLLCVLLLNWVHLILCEPALRGSLRQELDQEQKQQLQPEWKEGNASSAETPPQDSSTPADGNTTSRELQQTSVQSFTSTYQTPTGRFNDTTSTGVSGIGQQPQITTNPEGAGSNIVFGGGSQVGSPGIAGGGTIPTLGT